MLRLGYFGEIIQKDNLQKSLSSFFKFIPEFEEGCSIESYIQSCDVLFFSDCEKYFDGEADVVDMEKIINEFALLRNQWLGIIKGLDIKQWQLSNIIKLRTSGLEDVVL